MIPEFGHFALVFAFVLALVQSVVLVANFKGVQPFFARLIRRGTLAVGVLVLISFACLMYSFAVSDFSVVNVFQNSHTDKPFLFKLSGTWGNHEGSMLLWVLILCLFSALLALQSRKMPADLLSLALGIQMWIITAFLAFVLFTSNPFLRLLPAPLNGAGLNPLLQDVGLAIHPPFLYLGYVGFSIPFSFAVAALIRGKADNVWARLVRPWALAAWSFLTIGITLGSWWAYYELGWGGWWDWDPVENASFMPWLAGTALIHSIRIVEKRDAFKGWSVLLAIMAFSLSLVGTFLVRSGVITSVHAFATDPERGVFILAILLAATGGALLLYALRADMLRPTGVFSTVSRETVLLINNVLLVTSCATVFIGTLYPLFIDVLTGEKLTVDAPYFNIVFVPMACVMIILAATATLLPWKKGNMKSLAKRLRSPAIAAIAAGIIAAVLVNKELVISVFVVAIVVWLAAGTIVTLTGAIKLFRIPFAQSMARAKGLPRAIWGAAFAHLGLALFAFGVIGISLWQDKETFAMFEGDKAVVAGYEVTLKEVVTVEGPNYQAERAILSVRKGGFAATMTGESRFYPVRGMQTTEAAILPRLHGDLYISVEPRIAAPGWSVMIYFNPFVAFIWWGAGVTALGGFVAMTDRGRKPVVVKTDQKLADAPLTDHSKPTSVPKGTVIS